MTLDKVTIATRNTPAMAAFYSAVFGAGLKPSGPVWVGAIGSVQLMLCPAKIAGVNVATNNVQLRFVVADIEAAVHQALESGGRRLNDIEQSNAGLTAAVRDPDGNSVEIIQR